MEELRSGHDDVLLDTRCVERSKSGQEVTRKTSENGIEQQEVLSGLYGSQKWLLKEFHVPQSGAQACGGWCQTVLGLCYVTLATSSSWNVLSLLLRKTCTMACSRIVKLPIGKNAWFEVLCFFLNIYNM